ncbi:MAG TPA: class I SAM-dependent rRNA methyltransferase [Cyclobacteriaceae bacterium]|nr:class I SAM-dependent rRNA methyltransferase [Cyclobacteriaceae bacterium]
MEIKGKIILKRGKEVSIQRRHPWLFSGAIHQMEGTIADGDWVTVNDAGGGVLGHGHYQKGSITVRLLSFEKAQPGLDFYTEKISTAAQQRANINIQTTVTNSYRLIHGEGDGLPGLIVDMYNGVAVVQAHSHGMHHDRTVIAESIKKVFGENLTAVYYKNQTGSNARGEYLLGMSAVPHTILEHNHKFFVDWEEGQKTGFFLDQRENRKLLASYAMNRTVLNTFCYTGGFSVYAAQAGAALVHSVDASERAMEMTRKNLQLNGFDPSQHECFTADTFDFLKGKENRYDLIILDPPAFAKHKDSKHQAMKGYQRLNLEAIQKVKPGGIIFTFSCSQVVDRQLFYDTVVSSAIQSGREIKVLEHLGQPADHPVSIYHREGEYLKGLVLYVA